MKVTNLESTTKKMSVEEESMENNNRLSSMGDKGTSAPMDEDEDNITQMLPPLNLTSPIFKHKPIRAYNFLNNKERQRTLLVIRLTNARLFILTFFSLLFKSSR